jgi:hypothetical protein
MEDNIIFYLLLLVVGAAAALVAVVVEPVGEPPVPLVAVLPELTPVFGFI